MLKLGVLLRVWQYGYRAVKSGIHWVLSGILRESLTAGAEDVVRFERIYRQILYRPEQDLGTSIDLDTAGIGGSLVLVP